METEGTHTLPETSTSSLTTLIYAHNMFDNEEGDIMLRSFFNRAEQETESQQWLITPEPCLTSVPSTQKSIIEKCPMENMLIEQPSAFMNSSITAKKTELILNDITMAPAPKTPIVRRSYSCIVKSVSEKRKEPAAPIAELAPCTLISVCNIAVPVMTPPNTVVVEKVAEKLIAITAHNPSPTLPRLKKDSKKSKKNSSSGVSDQRSQHNKENAAVKILLMSNDFKKSNSAPRIDTLLGLNKKQMKRNNMSQGSTGSTLKQRRYHNLQQPTMSFATSTNF